MSDEKMLEAWDGDSAESRTGFRDFDRDCEVRDMTAWQIWRHACAWQASRTAQSEAQSVRPMFTHQDMIRYAKAVVEARDKRLAEQSEAKPVEIWKGDRKVTIYEDLVLRSWGPNIYTEMFDEPRTLDSVQKAIEWCFDCDGGPCVMDRTAQSEADVAKRVEPVAVRLECYAETQGEWFQVTERDAEHFKSCGCAVRALGVISDVTPAPVKPAESKSCIDTYDDEQRFLEPACPRCDGTGVIDVFGIEEKWNESCPECHGNQLAQRGDKA